MVYQRYVLSHSVQVISKNLCVDKSTVRRILKLFERTRSVDKKQVSVSRRKLYTTDKLELLIDKPSMYLSELKKELLFRGTNVHISTICRFIQSANFTRKKMRLIAAQQSEVRTLQRLPCTTRTC